MRETFEEYFSAVKELRTENNYDYTNEELEKYSSYFKDCWGFALLMGGNKICYIVITNILKFNYK